MPDPLDTRRANRVVQCKAMEITQPIYDNFRVGPSAVWRQIAVGRGQITTGLNGLRLAVSGATRQHYSDAQLDDIYGPERGLRWHAPVRLSLRARFSQPADQLRGTAGFGFWNAPLMPRTLPRLPRAAWFFFMSSHGNMPLALGTAGHGWKAAVIDTATPQALAWLPLAPLVVPLLNLPPLYAPLWRRVQAAVQVQEQALPTVDMAQWHIYTIDWQPHAVTFFVNGQPILHAPAPHGSLCCVLWIDNQYAIIEPRGRFGWGLLDAPAAQWLDIDWLILEPD